MDPAGEFPDLKVNGRFAGQVLPSASKGKFAEVRELAMGLVHPAPVNYQGICDSRDLQRAA
jgi:hypothetical protein